MKPVFLLLLCVNIHICYLPISVAQERPGNIPNAASRPTDATQNQSEDVVRVNTRVVFVDVSVKDAKTREPVRDLSLNNFQVFDDGKPRALTYFSREGDTLRPLSMLLFIDLWSMYGRKYLKQSAAMLRLADALPQLAPEDEVALMTTWIEEGDMHGVALPKVRLVSDFTSDHQRTIAALRSVPELVREQENLLEKISQDSGRPKWEIEVSWSLTEIAETVMTQDAARPKTQFVVVGLIDDLFALVRGERQAVAEVSARAGVTFYGLVYKKSFIGKLFFGALNQIIMRPRGKGLHAAGYLAEQTGGEVISVGRPNDLASGLERVITDLNSRYSLGFSLSDSERDDGRMHQLEVKVEARDKQGKRRRLKVRARQGYYVSEVSKASD